MITWLYTLVLPLISWVGSIFFFLSLLISMFFNVSLYRLSGVKLQRFTSEIKFASVYGSNGEMEEWVIGRFFIGRFFSSSEGYEGPTKVLYVLMSRRFYESKTQTPSASSNQKCEHITLYEREGNYSWLSYDSTTYTPRGFKTMVPRPSQESAVQEILTFFEGKDNCSCVIVGPPGLGKSAVSTLVCKKLLETRQGVSLVDSFRPTDPGDHFSKLYNKVRPDYSNPLVVVLEEVDRIISDIHHQTVITHKNVPTQMRNKCDWNTFFDQINRGRYPHVVFLMTSNQELEFFDDLDPSYFRDNRVDLKIRIC